MNHPPSQPAGTAPAWLVWAALLTVYVVWGSTYLAIAIVVETMPPLLSAGGRFLVAGTLLALMLVARHGLAVVRLRRAELLGSGFVGLALLLGGNGFVMLGQRDVPSGLAALIVAIVPLCVVVLRLMFGEQVRRGTVVGVLVGFAGMAVLVVPRGVDGTVDLLGMLMLVIAAASWAVGSFYSKRLDLPASPFVSTAAQMLAGGLGLVMAGVLAGELGLLDGGRAFSADSILALLYLVVFGSLITFTAYTWLLQHAPVSKVATYAYVNPVVAIFLGWLVLREEIAASILIGGAMVLLAVGLVVRTETRRPDRAGAVDAHPAQSALPVRWLKRVRAGARGAR